MVGLIRGVSEGLGPVGGAAAIYSLSGLLLIFTVGFPRIRQIPKGAGLLDYVNSENRLRYPEYRAPGSDKWQRISWEEAFSRIAKLMKADRDANFIEKNEQGVTVNRWLSTGMLCASGASNETGMLTQKFARSLGMLAVDNQARV